MNHHPIWPVVLGRFDWQALPFVRAWQDPSLSEIIGAGAGGIVVAGALFVVLLLTVTGRWGWLWREWLTSLDHKKIGIMYVVVALVMLARALIEANLIRLQQATAIDGPGFIEPDHFAQLFSTHGSIMIFFMAMPFLTGLINYVVPLQLGARDVSFPLLNSISLWLTGGGAGLMMISLVVGRFSTGGWSGYPPYTELAFSPDVGPDYWIWAVSLGSIGSTLTGLNIAVTIYKKRCPGLNLMRMPLFCWTSLCTSILMIFAMPPLTVATALLALDRYLGFHLFTNSLGGNMMMYANLFWMFGHPEVYIVILPAFGVYSEVVSTFSSKELYGYTSLVLATMAIAVLSFTVWVHHFFTMGQSANINSVFGIATMTIGVPTGVKIYDWIWTMFRGEVRFTTPMLFSIAFMMTFVLGGFTGIILAFPAARLSRPQHAVPGRTLPQHADPGHAVRDDRRLPILVPQGVRLPPQRALGTHLVRLLGGGLLCRVHAALRARRGRHDPAHAGGIRGRLPPVALHRGRRCGDPVRGARGPVHAALRQHPRARREPGHGGRSMGRAFARMVGLGTAARVQLRCHSPRPSP